MKKYWLIFENIVLLGNPERGIQFKAKSDQEALKKAKKLWDTLPVSFFASGMGMWVCGWSLYAEMLKGRRKHHRYIEKLGVV